MPISITEHRFERVRRFQRLDDYGPMGLRDRLTEAEIDCIAMTRLYEVMHMPVIRMNYGLITTLVEQWHSEMCTFHLAQGEMTVTLEDVWRILRIPIRGELVTYDRSWGTLAVQRIFDEDVFIDDGSIAWDEIAALYESLLAVLSGEGFFSSGRDAAAYLGLGVATSDSTSESKIPRSRLAVYVHGLPSGSGEYARVIRERYAWGPGLLYDQALAEFRTLQARPWDIRPRVVDVGVTDEYMQYRAAHPILQISDPAEPILDFEDERGRRRRRAGG
ncbi:hypothetical protein SUGI_1147540 [Cryptomeria japonica]|nr:hypothetical protein SUGI_1147540 [Cryptomeria japonica]